jgi:hypothetical protein
MNVVQTAGAIAGLLATVAGGVYALETRVEDKVDTRVTPIEAKLDSFVPLSEYSDFQWAYLKSELRDLRDAAEEASEEGDDSLWDDYEELLDLFCRKYPDDRECN